MGRLQELGASEQRYSLHEQFLWGGRKISVTVHDGLHNHWWHLTSAVKIVSGQVYTSYAPPSGTLTNQSKQAPAPQQLSCEDLSFTLGTALCFPGSLCSGRRPVFLAQLLALTPVPGLRALPPPVSNWSLLHHLLPTLPPQGLSSESSGSHWVLCLRGNLMNSEGRESEQRQGWPRPRQDLEGQWTWRQEDRGPGSPLPPANRVTEDQPLCLCFLVCKGESRTGISKTVLSSGYGD